MDTLQEQETIPLLFLCWCLLVLFEVWDFTHSYCDKIKILSVNIKCLKCRENHIPHHDVWYKNSEIPNTWVFCLGVCTGWGPQGFCSLLPLFNEIARHQTWCCWCPISDFFTLSPFLVSFGLHLSYERDLQKVHEKWHSEKTMHEFLFSCTKVNLSFNIILHKLFYILL